MVPLLYYSRTKKHYLPFAQIERLISPLLTDKEYYVQKGVGWALRELYTIYPEDAFAWLKAHIRMVSSIAFTICLEKMNTVTKEELKAIRKKRIYNNPIRLLINRFKLIDLRLNYTFKEFDHDCVGFLRIYMATLIYI